MKLNTEKLMLKAGDPVPSAIIVREHIRLILKKHRDIVKAARILGFTLRELQLYCRFLKVPREWKRVSAMRKKLEGVRVKL